jgi:predicted lysophospholipase L1 biosynthesis ABC-type transport system permease subunit
LLIGFTAFGVSVEHTVLSNQSLVLPSSEKWLLCASTFLCLLALGVIQMTSAMTTSPVSLSSSSANSRKAIKYVAAVYSIVAAIAVLVLGAILKDGIALLPVSLIGIMAIVCAGQVILDLRRHPHHRFSKF